MQVFRQSEPTASLRRVFFVLVDSASGAVKQTGKAGGLAGFATKKGAAAAALTGSFTEVDADMPGLYYYQAAALELDTVGRLVFEFSAAACLTRTVVVHVGTVDEDLATATALASVASGVTGMPVAVDALLSASHGAGDWGTESTGAMAVTVTLEDSVSGLPISGAAVYVRNIAATVLYDWGITDENGAAGFLLDNGGFRVWCTKVGSYTFPNPAALTVSGTTSLTIEGTPFSPTTPVGPDLCTVFGWTLDIAGQPVSVAVSSEVIGDTHFLTAHQEIIRGAKTASSASADGYWEIALTRSAKYIESTVKYSFTVAGVHIGAFVVPDSAAVGLHELVGG